MRRAAFRPRARFRLLDEAGESADFEIEGGGGDGAVVACRLDSDALRTFDQLEMRRMLAERRLQFQLEGRHDRRGPRATAAEDLIDVVRVRADVSAPVQGVLGDLRNYTTVNGCRGGRPVTHAAYKVCLEWRMLALTGKFARGTIFKWAT